MSIAATYGLVAVLLGAFAAHGLKEVLSASSLASWQTGVTYQMTHALVLLVIGLWLRQGGSNLVKVAGVLFAIGVLVFSGSIYALVLLQVGWLGPVTPLRWVVFDCWLGLYVGCSGSVGIRSVERDRKSQELHVYRREYGIE